MHTQVLSQQSSVNSRVTSLIHRVERVHSWSSHVPRAPTASVAALTHHTALLHAVWSVELGATT